MNDTATRRDFETFVARHVEAWQRHDAAALASHHSPNGVIVSPMFSTITGRRAIEESYRSLFHSFPDWSFTVETLVIDPPRLAVISRSKATHVNDFMGLPGTHKRIEFSGARFMTFEDGFIATEHRVYDFTGLLIQMGVLRAKPAH